MESEIKSWLKVVLKDEDIENFSVNILGNSEKGDGYLGDIVFLSLTPINGHSGPEYDLVLKCSKRSTALRESAPVKEAFVNEIFFYDTVLPAFTQFQLEKGITDPFDSVPKFYGKFRNEDMEVLVFENLKKAGYALWDKKKPLTRNHINMVISEYAKFHAISIAMKEQRPEIFEKLVGGLDDIFGYFLNTSSSYEMFQNCLDEQSEILKDELNENILLKWGKSKEQIPYIFGDMVKDINGLKVILHGDCWNNNFMFKHACDDKLVPIKHAKLDWQICRYSTPILDLSYFIFACISEEDIENLNDILKHYYEKLTQFLKNLGSNYFTLYSFEHFLEDWKKYCRYGIIMAPGIFKICSTDKEDVIDIAQAVENGGDFMSAFSYNVKDKALLKNRSRYFVKYVIENSLI